MITIKNVNKNFGGVKALRRCTLETFQGQITAIIGPNGSGKTTLFNSISRLLQIDMGNIYFQKKNLKKFCDYEVAKLGNSRTFQEVRLFNNLTIQQHLEIAISETDELLFKNFFSKHKSMVKKVKEILSLVSLDKSLGTYATDLSYGQRKLLDLAIALAKPHAVLMLDEPVAGVNPSLRNQIKLVLKKLKKEGETIVLIEHDMNFVMDIADTIFVLDSGTVIASGTPKQIQNNKKVLDAYLGE